MCEWAETAVVSAGTFKSRIKRGWEPLRAWATPLTR